MKEIWLRDYQSKICKVQLRDEIKMIIINVISGDETAIIVYEDGTSEEFDSSSNRYINYYDGTYIVPADRLEEFNDLKGDSYDRMEKALEWTGGEDV